MQITEEDTMTVKTIALADAAGREYAEKQCIDIEQANRDEWDAMVGCTLSSADLGDEPGSRYLVQLLDGEQVIDQYETVSA